MPKHSGCVSLKDRPGLTRERGGRQVLRTNPRLFLFRCNPGFRRDKQLLMPLPMPTSTRLSVKLSQRLRGSEVPQFVYSRRAVHVSSTARVLFTNHRPQGQAMLRSRPTILRECISPCMHRLIRCTFAHFKTKTSTTFVFLFDIRTTTNKYIQTILVFLIYARKRKTVQQTVVITTWHHLYGEFTLKCRIVVEHIGAYY